VDLTRGVAVRVSALSLEAGGRVPDRLLTSDAVRAALLLDLVLAGRMTSTEDSIVMDSTPTGFAPADRLLAAIEAEPERSLDGWLEERRLGLRDVVAANVASGRWERRAGLLGLRARYTDRHAGQTVRDRARSMSDWPADASPDDACVTVVAGASGLLDAELDLPADPPPDLIAATGPAAWLCPTAVDHLRRAHARYRDQASALGGGVVGPF
jgi:Golgi phosphoprotein 3 (GPP34)